MSPLSKIKTQIIKAIGEVYPGSTLVILDIVPTPDPKLGDLAVPMFKLAKVAGKAPSMIAEELRGKIFGVKALESAEVAGPYLNLRFKKAVVAKEVMAMISKDKTKYGNGKATKEKIMVEYVAPNTNKPLHLGHLRNAALGESLCRILEAAGNKVVRANLLSDRGIGVTKAMVAYERWGDNETPVSAGVKGDHLVGKYYVMFEQKKVQHPEIENEVVKTLQKWEAGEPAARALWRTMTKWCIDGQNATLKMLGVKYDKVYRESALYKEGSKMVLAALQQGIFSKDEKGNIVAKLPNQPDKVVLRADGTAVYITTDLPLTVKKMTEFKLNKCLWVVGMEQDLHLRQLVGIMRLLGYKWADDLEHVSYGHVALPEGRMKSREGTVVDIDELVQHLSELAAAEIKERHDFLDQSEIDKRAQEIALGAVKFYLLSVSAPNGMTFNPKESLAFVGKTGPYLQYTNARIQSILRKAAELGSTGAGRVDVSVLNTPTEWQLVMRLAEFADVISSAANERDPSIVARYCYDLSKSFAEFYEQAPVLKADPSVRRARLSLLRAVGLVLGRSMYLLGIPAPKEM
jgi:arginyl-tRNA synthetase